MTSPKSTAAWAASILQGLAALLALGASAVLALTTLSTPSIAGSHRLADTFWGLLAALPAGITAAVALVTLALALRPATRLRSLGEGIAIGAVCMVPMVLLGAAWAVLLASGNDAKWGCVFAAVVSLVATALLGASGFALVRASRSTEAS